MKHTFQLKTQKKCLELPLTLLETGLTKVRSTLLQLHTGLDSIIQRTYILLRGAVRLMAMKGKSVIVECHPHIKPMILKDKKIFSDLNTLTMNWLQISVRGLTGKERDLKPFWNEQCKEVSQSLWLPTETDSADLHSNSSSTSWKRKELNSLFSIEKIKNPKIKNCATTYSPLSMYIHPGKWDDEGIRSRKLRLYPTEKQKSMLKRWIGISRYVYNQALAGTKGEDEINWMTLRNKYVTAKGNNLKDWELEVPNDVRAGAIRDLYKAYKTAFSNLRNNNISRFSIGWRTRKSEPSIVIPKRAIKLNTGKVTIFKRFGLDPIKTCKDRSLSSLKIDNDCRLGVNKGKWFLYIPVMKKTVDPRSDDECALDPGIRKFQTLYSNKEIVKVVPNKEMRAKLYLKKDKICSLEKCKTRKRAISRINYKITNLTDDMHYKFINYIKTNYRTVHIPEFETQKLGLKNRKVNRIMYDLKHYQFRTRLMDNFALVRHAGAVVCTEEYTSKTCTKCGSINNIGSAETYKCNTCGLVIDRDVNGARNIFIKYH